ncbi:MAG: phosphoribosylformylglycinamidine cyclo-ligase, partial [Leucobacter sp.]
MFAVVAEDRAAAVAERLRAEGVDTWTAGAVSTADRDFAGFEQGAKGVQGGAVRLVGGYAA